MCRHPFCESSEGTIHWFLTPGESVGCTNLKPGFGEILTSSRMTTKGFLVNTNLLPWTPLTNLCLGESYCGRSPVIGPGFSGFVMDSQSIGLQENLIKKLKSCPRSFSLVPVDPLTYISRRNFEDTFSIESSVCEDQLTRSLSDGSLSGRYLNLFGPKLEGISPGYRIESGTLYEYDLVYVSGTFKSLRSNGTGPTEYVWTITDSAGEVHTLSQSLCQFVTEGENSLTGPTCNWFNGIKLRGSDMLVPSVWNQFCPDESFDRTNYKEFSGSHINMTGTNTQSTSVQDWISGNIWHLALGLGIFTVIVCLPAVEGHNRIV